MDESAAEAENAMKMVEDVKSEQAKRRYSGKLQVITDQLQKLSSEVGDRNESMTKMAQEMQGHRETQIGVKEEIESMKNALADIHDNPLCITPRESPTSASLPVRVEEMLQAQHQAQTQLQGGVDQVEEQVSLLREQLRELAVNVTAHEGLREGMQTLEADMAAMKETQMMMTAPNNPPPVDDSKTFSVNDMKIKQIQSQLDKISSQVESFHDNLTDNTMRLDGLEDHLSGFEDKLDKIDEQMDASAKAAMQKSDIDDTVCIGRSFGFAPLQS